MLLSDLGVLFGTSFELNFKASMSAMLEVNVATGAIDTMHAADLGQSHGIVVGSMLETDTHLVGYSIVLCFPSSALPRVQRIHDSFTTDNLTLHTIKMKTAAGCYNDATQANQETYIAFYMSQSREISMVLSIVLDPFGKFGEFRTSLIPVKDVSVALRHYVKLRESIFEKWCIQILM